MKCYFCGSDLYVNKIKIKGKENGKRRTKTCGICACCSAMTDDYWIEEKMGWDEGSLKWVK